MAVTLGAGAKFNASESSNSQSNCMLPNVAEFSECDFVSTSELSTNSDDFSDGSHAQQTVDDLPDCLLKTPGGSQCHSPPPTLEPIVKSSGDATMSLNASKSSQEYLPHFPPMLLSEVSVTRSRGSSTKTDITSHTLECVQQKTENTMLPGSQRESDEQSTPNPLSESSDRKQEPSRTMKTMMKRLISSRGYIGACGLVNDTTPKNSGLAHASVGNSAETNTSHTQLQTKERKRGFPFANDDNESLICPRQQKNAREHADGHKPNSFLPQYRSSGMTMLCEKNDVLLQCGAAKSTHSNSDVDQSMEPEGGEKKQFVIEIFQSDKCNSVRRMTSRPSRMVSRHSSPLDQATSRSCSPVAVDCSSTSAEQSYGRSLRTLRHVNKFVVQQEQQEKSSGLKNEDGAMTSTSCRPILPRKSLDRVYEKVYSDMNKAHASFFSIKGTVIPGVCEAISSKSCVSVTNVENQSDHCFYSKALDDYLRNAAKLTVSFSIPGVDTACTVEHSNSRLQCTKSSKFAIPPPKKRSSAFRFKTVIDMQLHHGMISLPEYDRAVARRTRTHSQIGGANERSNYPHLFFSQLRRERTLQQPVLNADDLEVNRLGRCLPLSAVLHQSLAERRSWDLDSCRGQQCYVYANNRQVLLPDSSSWQHCFIRTTNTNSREEKQDENVFVSGGAAFATERAQQPISDRFCFTSGSYLKPTVIDRSHAVMAVTACRNQVHHEKPQSPAITRLKRKPYKRRSVFTKRPIASKRSNFALPPDDPNRTFEISTDKRCAVLNKLIDQCNELTAEVSRTLAPPTKQLSANPASVVQINNDLLRPIEIKQTLLKSKSESVGSQLECDDASTNKINEQMRCNGELSKLDAVTISSMGTRVPDSSGRTPSDPSATDCNRLRNMASGTDCGQSSDGADIISGNTLSTSRGSTENTSLTLQLSETDEDSSCIESDVSSVSSDTDMFDSICRSSESDAESDSPASPRTSMNDEDVVCRIKKLLHSSGVHQLTGAVLMSTGLSGRSSAVVQSDTSDQRVGIRPDGVVNNHKPKARKSTFASAIKSCCQPHCRLGCVCASLRCARRQLLHCGRVECMFECSCKAVIRRSTVGRPKQRLKRISLIKTEKHIDKPVVSACSFADSRPDESVATRTNATEQCVSLPNVLTVGSSCPTPRLTPRSVSTFSEDKLDGMYWQLVHQRCEVNVCRTNLPSTAVPYCMFHQRTGCSEFSARGDCFISTVRGEMCQLGRNVARSRSFVQPSLAVDNVCDNVIADSDALCSRVSPVTRCNTVRLTRHLYDEDQQCVVTASERSDSVNTKRLLAAQLGKLWLKSPVPLDRNTIAKIVVLYQGEDDGDNERGGGGVFQPKFGMFSHTGTITVLTSMKQASSDRPWQIADADGVVVYDDQGSVFRNPVRQEACVSPSFTTEEVEVNVDGDVCAMSCIDLPIVNHLIATGWMSVKPSEIGSLTIWLTKQATGTATTVSQCRPSRYVLRRVCRILHRLCCSGLMRVRLDMHAPLMHVIGVVNNTRSDSIVSMETKSRLMFTEWLRGHSPWHWCTILAAMNAVDVSSVSHIMRKSVSSQFHNINVSSGVTPAVTITPQAISSRKGSVTASARSSVGGGMHLSQLKTKIAITGLTSGHPGSSNNMLSRTTVATTTPALSTLKQVLKSSVTPTAQTQRALVLPHIPAAQILHIKNSSVIGRNINQFPPVNSPAVSSAVISHEPHTCLSHSSVARTEAINLQTVAKSAIGMTPFSLNPASILSSVPFQSQSQSCVFSSQSSSSTVQTSPPTTTASLPLVSDRLKQLLKNPSLIGPNSRTKMHPTSARSICQSGASMIKPQKVPKSVIKTLVRPTKGVVVLADSSGNPQRTVRAGSTDVSRSSETVCVGGVSLSRSSPSARVTGTSATRCSLPPRADNTVESAGGISAARLSFVSTPPQLVRGQLMRVMFGGRPCVFSRLLLSSLPQLLQVEGLPLPLTRRYIEHAVASSKLTLRPSTVKLAEHTVSILWLPRYHDSAFLGPLTSCALKKAATSSAAAEAHRRLTKRPVWDASQVGVRPTVVETSTNHAPVAGAVRAICSEDNIVDDDEVMVLSPPAKPKPIEIVLADSDDDQDLTSFSVPAAAPTSFPSPASSQFAATNSDATNERYERVSSVTTAPTRAVSVAAASSDGHLTIPELATVVSTASITAGPASLSLIAAPAVASSIDKTAVAGSRGISASQTKTRLKYLRQLKRLERLVFRRTADRDRQHPTIAIVDQALHVCGRLARRCGLLRRRLWRVRCRQCRMIDKINTRINALPFESRIEKAAEIEEFVPFLQVHVGDGDGRASGPCLTVRKKHAPHDQHMSGGGNVAAICASSAEPGRVAAVIAPAADGVQDGAADCADIQELVII